jgi:hypothetical protein
MATKSKKAAATKCKARAERKKEMPELETVDFYAAWCEENGKIGLRIRDGDKLRDVVFIAFEENLDEIEDAVNISREKLAEEAEAEEEGENEED